MITELVALRHQLQETIRTWQRTHPLQAGHPPEILLMSPTFFEGGQGLEQRKLPCTCGQTMQVWIIWANTPEVLSTLLDQHEHELCQGSLLNWQHHEQQHQTPSEPWPMVEPSQEPWTEEILLNESQK